MAFVSYQFIAFALGVLLLYYLLPRKAQWPLLLVASVCYFAFFGWEDLIFIAAATVISYVCARIMAKISDSHHAFIEAHRDEYTKDERKELKARTKKKRSRIMAAGLIIEFLMLGVTKYTAFAIENVNSVASWFGSEGFKVPNLLEITGISYFVFMTTAYLIDVNREKAAVERNFFKYSLFVCFFPQLVQGPISRFGDLEAQLCTPHAPTYDNISAGLRRVLWGYFKKVIVADRMLSAVKIIILGTTESAGAAYRGVYVVAVILFYTIQLYADFTGGIDITIGLARAMGITLAENFRHPFFSKTTKEYWNRWHITMGTWFTDYIFYPMSVSKPMLKLSRWSREKLGTTIGKRVPVYFATIVTWFATGLWHGAAWNYIVWGLLNCLIILVAQELAPLFTKAAKKCPALFASKFHDYFMMFHTFWLMATVRILDCYRNVGLTFRMWGSVFTTANWGDLFNGALLNLERVEDNVSTYSTGAVYWITILIGCVIMFAVSVIDVKKPIGERLKDKPCKTAVLCAVMLVCILIFGAYGSGYDASNFIYGQF